MLRRNARLRKEYCLKKLLQDKENAIRERKKNIKSSLQQGVPINPEDAKFEFEHRNAADIEDATSLRPVSIMDNEYAYAGAKDPVVLLTTSRHPSSRLIAFVKELNLIFPNSYRINRGTYVLKDVVALGQSRSASDIIIVHEHRGVPNGMVVSHLPLGPTVSFEIRDVVLRHDLETKPPPMSTAYPHLIFENFTSVLGQRIMSVLKFLFPPASPLKQRVLSFVNVHDLIHFRHFIWEDKRHELKKQKDFKNSCDEDVEGNTEVNDTDTGEVAAKVANKKAEEAQAKGDDQIVLEEVGPRFTLRPYKIELGTLDMVEVDVEWALKSFINSAKEALA